jgi:DNA-directed RNA polymerase subunit alpha
LIEKNWKELIKPSQLEVIPGVDPRRNASVIVEPLERGFGLTIGNALRRILLSSLQGAAVTSVKFDGVLHEFTSIPGVREDVTNVVLNLKKLIMRMLADDGSRKLRLAVSGPKVVTGWDVEEAGIVEVINKDLVLCHLDADSSLVMELEVSSGRGYIPADSSKLEEAASIGTISVDALYSPVLRVSYSVESTREGSVLDYDKLVLSIETDGSVIPQDAVAFAARILQDQMQLFINFDDPESERIGEDENEFPFNPAFVKKVEELELSVRSANCLKNDNIVYIGDLIQRTESEMLRTPNFGRKSLNEIKEVLLGMGLHLGSEVKDWPPENIEYLIQKFDDQV